MFQRFAKPPRGPSPRGSSTTYSSPCLSAAKRFPKLRALAAPDLFRPQLLFVFKGVQAYRLPGPKPYKPFRMPFEARSYTPRPSVFDGVQACRLPGPKFSGRPFQGNSRSYTPRPSAFPRQLSQLHALAICFWRRSSLLFAGPQTLPQAFPRQFSVFDGVQAVCRPQTLQTVLQAFPRQLSQLRHGHLFLTAFKPAVCRAPSASNSPAGLSKATLAATRHEHFFWRRSSLPFAGPQTLQTFCYRNLLTQTIPTSVTFLLMDFHRGNSGKRLAFSSAFFEP